MDEDDRRLHSSRKRAEKYVLDKSGKKTKTGRIPNKKRKTGTRFSSPTQKTTISASQVVNVPANVCIKKPDRKVEVFS